MDFKRNLRWLLGDGEMRKMNMKILDVIRNDEELNKLRQE